MSGVLKLPRFSFGRRGSESSATIRPRIASISGDDTRPAATCGNEDAMSLRPVSASGAFRTERISVSSLPRSVTVRTRYMTASTKPQARP